MIGSVDNGSGYPGDRGGWCECGPLVVVGECPFGGTARECWAAERAFLASVRAVPVGVARTSCRKPI